MSFKLHSSCKRSESSCCSNSKSPIYNFVEADIIFNIDSSGSTSSSDSAWYELKQFITNLIITLPVSENGIRIGITQFAVIAALKSPLTSNVSNLLSVVESMSREYGVGSFGCTGLKLALEEYNLNGRSLVPKIIISISDGSWGGTILFKTTTFTELTNAKIDFTFILKDSDPFLVPPREWYTYTPYNIKTGNTYVSDFNKIITYIYGLTLMREPLDPVVMPIDKYTIKFDNINVSNIQTITEEKTLFMAKSGLLIVNYNPYTGSTDPYPYTLLFNLPNTLLSLNKLATFFNLRGETNSRIIRVIRSGILTEDIPPNFSKKTVLGINGVLNPEENYIFFQVNGDGDDIQTTTFTTYSDWSFVVSLTYTTYERICFNILI